MTLTKQQIESKLRDPFIDKFPLVGGTFSQHDFHKLIDETK